MICHRRSVKTIGQYFFFFIYCHLYSALSIVQCSNALYRLWDGEIQGHTGQPSVREIDSHTMYNQWATAPGLSLNYPRPKSITHLRTFSDNGVYVALQLFLVILVSDQWCRVLIPYSYRQAPWGLLHARGWKYELFFPLEWDKLHDTPSLFYDITLYM